MGKERNRGGAQNHQNNKQGKNRHGNPRDKARQKFCKNCGDNNSHVTKDCFKSHGNKTGNPSKVDKQKNKNSHENRKVLCSRCGFWNHEERNCTAKELSEEDWCECGSAYHYSSKCPWKNDPLEREQAQNMATGKICQWCKADGDGAHVLEECKEVTKFRNVLKTDILRAYDKLLWCWHCGSDNHKTRACKSTSANGGATRWWAKIEDIIQEWVTKDLSNVAPEYINGEEDVFMGIAGPGLRAPLPHKYPWCLYCQTFGHAAGTAQSCDTSEFDRKCPARFQGERVDKPFVPSSIESSNTSTSSDSFAGSRTMTADCIVDRCKNRISFNLPCPPNGSSVICPKCQTQNFHPHVRGRTFESVELLKLFIQAQNGLHPEKGEESKSKSKSKNQIDHRDPNKQVRPSVFLPRELALERWPERQPPFYDDGGARRTSTNEALIKHQYFDRTDNTQAYFPPIIIYLDAMARQIRDDDSRAINRAGRMGLELKCVKCNAFAQVRDAEGDLVMCGTEVANTAGCGWGVAEWVGTSARDVCKCLRILGEGATPQWVMPQPG